MESSNHNVPPKGNPSVDENEEPVNLVGGYVLDFIRHQENHTAKIENIIEALARDVELDYDTVSGFVYEAIEDGISLCILSCDFEDGCVIANIDFPEPQECPKASRNKEPKTDLVPQEDPSRLKSLLKNATNYMPEKVENGAPTALEKKKEYMKRHIKKVIRKENFCIQEKKPPISRNTLVELDFLAELGVGEVREENSISNTKAKKPSKLAKDLCDDKRRKGRKRRKRHH